MALNEVSDVLTNLFKNLSDMPSEINDTQIDILESFLIKVYQQNARSDVCLDTFRMNQFSKSSTFNPRLLILSRKGLIEHTKRASLQAGWIWKECEINV